MDTGDLDMTKRGRVWEVKFKVSALFTRKKKTPWMDDPRANSWFNLWACYR